MKFTGTIKKFGFVLILAAVLLAAGCDNSGDSSGGGSLNIGTLSTLYFEDYDDPSSPFNIGVWLSSSDAGWVGDEYGTGTGTGTIIFLSMYSNTKNPISEETYSFSANEVISSNTFDFGFIISLSNSSPEGFYFIDGGSVVISKSGDNYTITGNLNLYDIFEDTPAGTTSFSFTGLEQPPTGDVS